MKTAIELFKDSVEAVGEDFQECDAAQRLHAAIELTRLSIGVQQHTEHMAESRRCHEVASRELGGMLSITRIGEGGPCSSPKSAAQDQ